MAEHISKYISGTNLDLYYNLKTLFQFLIEDERDAEMMVKLVDTLIHNAYSNGGINAFEQVERVLSR